MSTAITRPDAACTTVVRAATVKPTAALYWTSIAMAVAAAAALTAFVPGVLRGTAVMNGSASATALAVLFVAVPTLVAATPFNSLFLIYVATFTLGFCTLVGLLRAVETELFASGIAAKVPARALAVYLAVIAGLNAAAGLAVVVHLGGSW